MSPSRFSIAARAAAQAGRWFVDVERAASRQGHTRDPSQGPGAFLSQIAHDTPDARAQLLHARALYLAARFGERALEEPDERALKEALRALRRAARRQKS